MFGKLVPLKRFNLKGVMRSTRFEEEGGDLYQQDGRSHGFAIDVERVAKNFRRSMWLAMRPSG